MPPLLVIYKPLFACPALAAPFTTEPAMSVFPEDLICILVPLLVNADAV